MTYQTKLAKELLTAGSYSLVIVKDDQTCTFHESGVRPLLSLIQQNNKTIHGGYAADKVIGKAAAMLFKLGGIKEVYANVISETALQFLTSAGIPCSYGEKAPYIMNRSQTGMCPMEHCCLHLTQPEQAYQQIVQELERLSHKKTVAN